jgi:hypothetical protein
MTPPESKASQAKASQPIASPTKPARTVAIEHQLYHCPGCGKMVGVMLKCPLAAQKLGRPHRAIMHWCEQCRFGYVMIQRFNDQSWDLLGKQRKTFNRNHLESLRATIESIESAADVEVAIDREAAAPDMLADPDDQRQPEIEDSQIFDQPGDETQQRVA